MTENLAIHVLTTAGREFHSLKDLADKAMGQVDDAAFFASLGDETNSVALVVKHLSGNMRSRWTDFLTTDGEKLWRCSCCLHYVQEFDRSLHRCNHWIRETYLDQRVRASWQELTPGLALGSTRQL